MNEPRAIHAAEDWSVVLQSVPSRNKKEIVKRLEEIFELEKHDAEQVLSNMPLILLDNLSFGLAARIKKYFQKVGAVAETTNHDMIKKNCFQIVWPQTPDLSFFMKNETGPQETLAQEKKSDPKLAEIPATGKKAEKQDVKPEAPKVAQAEVPQPPKTVSEPSAIPAHDLPKVPEEKPAVSSTGADSDWERRAKELNEKLQMIHEEKQVLHAQSEEAAEKAKCEFQQRLDEEKKKSDEIAKAYEDLQAEARKQEALTREGEEWRSRAVALGEKVRELETNLMQKTAAFVQVTQERDALVSQAGKAGELISRLEEAGKIVAAREGDSAALQGRVSELEASLSEANRQLAGSRDREQELSRKIVDLDAGLMAGNDEKTLLKNRVAQMESSISDSGRELETLRNREREFSGKIAALEGNIQEMTEALRARDGALARFEKQIAELAEKTQGYEALRQEHAELSRERSTFRQDYETKFAAQEVRLAKAEEEHRRYRSHADRKNAAATRELGKSIHGVDTIRQGLQKLILFLGSDSAVLDSERKPALRSPLTRGPDAPSAEKS